jgi:hypothetical protein
MKNLDFNLYGFAAPRTRAEYLNLLGEALRLADELSAQIDEMENILENAGEAAASA